MFTMEIKIREIEVEDYKELLDFMKKVRETNFLRGYPNEIKMSYEDEKEYIKIIMNGIKFIYLLLITQFISLKIKKITLWQ